MGRRLLYVGGLLTVAALAAVGLMMPGRARGPESPYGHRGLSEVSRAIETIVEGQASTVADGLRQHGYWCVQPRSNDLTVQIACRSPQRDVRVDVMAARDGAVVYADVDLRVMATSSLDAERRLDRILQASCYQLWPQERQTVEDLLEDARSARSMPFGQQAAPMDPAEQYSTHDQRGVDISWSLRARCTGEPLALRLRSEASRTGPGPSAGSTTRPRSTSQRPR